LFWIQSHNGIKRNEIADKLANKGTAGGGIDIPLGHELHDVYINLNSYIDNLWPKHVTPSRFYKNAEPSVGLLPKLATQLRSSESFFARFRMGRVVSS
jgi:hypothetical protein